MTAEIKPDYSSLDRQQVLSVLFHPRPEMHDSPAHPPSCDIMIPVAEDVKIGARFHLSNKSGANILFFHGNGEIVADYHDLGPLYNRADINFLAVDYRGYGRSGGRPTVSAMMQDCHTIFEFTSSWLKENSYTGPIIVMGRSLGSASALELASSCGDKIGALAIESGFAYAGPLLQLLGIAPDTIGFDEQAGFRNIDKISTYNKPVLIIHAEFDHIIPYAEGLALFEACPSETKTMLTISGANHNDIFMRGFQEYLQAVKKLTEQVTA